MENMKPKYSVDITEANDKYSALLNAPGISHAFDSIKNRRGRRRVCLLVWRRPSSCLVVGVTLDLHLHLSVTPS
ncbi:hypothetical protein KIN20_030388 [Parelaphostrongylus tenuis]|uniref:Uncharacterized protein n=1 Tax=Parelaphostrongylus tenuis TaxID=148309 RepID=A0AAD5R3N1_PARTN|nr:hypothetical protein KIN20_030388 [Parelaphostrongylus tenuis]